MAQQPVELILLRHMASRLAVPVFVVDVDGDLIYFNEPAERVLGRRYSEVRVMVFDEWTTIFEPQAEGRRLTVDELPLVIALRTRTPSHRALEIVDAEEVTRTIEATAFPIVTPDERLLGAVAMFWETEPA